MRRRGPLIGAALVALLAGGTVAYQAATGDRGAPTLRVGLLPWAVAIDGASGHAFVLDRTTDWTGQSVGAGNVSVVDARAARVLHTIFVGPDPRAVAVDERAGRVYVANDDDASVSVLDARGETVARTISVGAQPRAMALDTRLGRGYVVNTGDNTVSVLDLRRGVTVWTIHVETEMFHASAAVDERTGHLFVGGLGVVTMFDARSGATLRTIPLRAGANQMAVDERSGEVFVAEDHEVDVLDGRTGLVRRRFTMAEAISAVGIDARRGRLFVAHPGLLDNQGNPIGRGSVSVLDARSGAVLRTIGVGVAPVAIAVDEQSGRALVVNAGGNVPLGDPWGWLPSWLRDHLPWIAHHSGGTRAVPGSVSLVDNAS